MWLKADCLFSLEEDHSDLSLKGAVDLSNKSIPLSSDTEEDPDPECIGTTFSGVRNCMNKDSGLFMCVFADTH